MGQSRKKARMTSVADLVSKLSDDPKFAEGVKSSLAGKRIGREIFAQRAAKGLTQAAIAEKLGWSQSRVSKLEHGDDVDIRMGDLVQFAKALDFDVCVTLRNRPSTLVDDVKFYAYQIKCALNQMVELAGDDERIARGVSSFHGEAFFNLVKILTESADGLPRQVIEQESPHFCIEPSHHAIDEVDCERRELQTA